MRSPHTATRESPRSSEDPAQPKINKFFKKKKKKGESSTKRILRNLKGKGRKMERMFVVSSQYSQERRVEFTY